MSRYPWDTQLVSELSEAELDLYADFLRHSGVLERQAALDRLVDLALRELKKRRDDAVYGPSPYIKPEGRLNLPFSVLREGQPVYRTVSVLVPLWLEDDALAYIVREQLTEQLEEDRG